MTERDRDLEQDRDEAAEALPLRGVRVIDLSMGWSGPLATRQLADMGAEVIKVESCRYFDWWRTHERTSEALARVELAPAFITMNRGKLGVTLDLNTPRGVELLGRLVEGADALIENYAAGVLDRLGLGYERLCTWNPELIVLSMPAYGTSGPWREHRAYGSTVEQAAGLPHLNGTADGPPTMQHVAWGDAVGGLNAASALLIALWHRRRTGRGQRVDLSQVQSLFPLGAHGILEQTLNGREPVRLGSRHPDHAPHGVYPALDEDRWIAITTGSDADWQALCRAIGRADWAADPALASAAGRKAREDELDAGIGEWTRVRDPHAAMAELQAAGVPAAAVNRIAELLGDPQLQARGFWQLVDRPISGVKPLPSAPYRFVGGPGAGDGPVPVRRPTPTLGQHNREVLGELLGLGEAELEALHREGVIGTEPA